MGGGLSGFLGARVRGYFSPLVGCQAMWPAEKQIKLWVCECKSRTAHSCVQRFVGACVFSVCGYLECVLGRSSLENSLFGGGGCSDSYKGGPGG